MQRTITHSILGFKKPGHGEAPRKSDHILSDRFLRDRFVSTFKGRALAVSIFLYYFIEQGTLGLLPEKSYIIYRNVRISDLIMFATVIYSFFNIREFYPLFKSKALLITKIFLAYVILEFAISFLKYDFNILEYTFRLKGLWSSLLVFPFLLLYKRNGVGFLVKIIFPVAIISNVLYILTALTGIAFLPDITIISQRLPGEIVIYRVYGGTFFGEMFFLGFIYMWINRKFRLWQLFLVILFLLPHILAFGRAAWANLVYTILLFALVNSLRKKQFKVLFRQIMIFILVGIVFIGSFILIIPEADYYFEALAIRLTQGQEEVKYNEGSYGTRVIFQNNALVRLWTNSDMLLGIGMHPMWVVKPESFEEQVYYNAFSDVAWPGTLAAYGIFGFVLALIFQIYYMFTSWKLIKKAREPNVQTFFLTYLFAKLTFDTFLNFNYVFLSVGIWGLCPVLNFFVAVVVVDYEKQKQLDSGNTVTPKLLKEKAGKPYKNAENYTKYNPGQD